MAAQRSTGRPVVYRTIQDECVWSQAGVIKPIKCINAFDCLGCSFDKKVQNDFQAREHHKGPNSLEHTPPRLRMLVKDLKCRHMLSGRVAYKLCAHGYNCVKCPYDQMIEDSGILPAPSAPAYDSVSGFSVARDYYYLRGHTWARVEYGGRVRVGLDDFALRVFGPQDRITLPKLGSSVGQNQPGAVLQRKGREAASASPLDGKVVALNPEIGRRAETANAAPYTDGWLMVIQPTNLRKNLKNLLFGEESLAWVDHEANRLSRMVSDTAGYAMAAAGGEVNELASSFL
jgi:glycine cleavage system H lipoate-binding protein